MADTSSSSTTPPPPGFFNFREDFLRVRNEILSLKDVETVNFSFTTAEELSTCFAYISDMWKSYKTNAKAHLLYVCRYLDLAPKRTAKRSEQPLESSKRQKTLKVQTAACTAKLYYDSEKLMIRVLGHSCDKQFHVYPQILRDVVSNSLISQLVSGNISKDALQSTRNTINYSRFALLVPRTGQDLSQFIRNLANKLKNKIKSGDINESLLRLKDSPVILDADVLYVETLSSQHFGRSVLVFAYSLPVMVLKKILDNSNVVVVFSMDTTHNVASKSQVSSSSFQSLPHSYLLSIKFRSPDSLKYLIFLQAFVQGEDAASITLVLKWFNEKILNITNSAAKRMFLIDDSAAELSALHRVFGPNEVVFICIWHVYRYILKHFDFKLAPLAKQSSIQHNFSTESIKIFKKLAIRGVKCVTTIYHEKHSRYALKISDALAKIDCWWNDKSGHSLEQERSWWENFLVGRQARCMAFRTNFPDLSIRYASLQEKSTSLSETFHSILKEGGNKALLKQSDISASTIFVLNAVSHYNNLHFEAISKIYFTPPLSTPLLRSYKNFVDLYPRKIVGLFLSEYAEIKSIVTISETPLPLTEKQASKPQLYQRVVSAKMTLVKWQQKHQMPSVLMHQCKHLIGFGVICRHLFFFLEFSSFDRTQARSWRSTSMSPILELVRIRYHSVVLSNSLAITNSLLSQEELPTQASSLSVYAEDLLIDDPFQLPSVPTVILRSTTVPNRIILHVRSDSANATPAQDSTVNSRITVVPVSDSPDRNHAGAVRPESSENPTSSLSESSYPSISSVDDAGNTIQTGTIQTNLQRTEPVRIGVVQTVDITGKRKTLSRMIAEAESDGRQRAFSPS